ncbi:hypothetical protein SK128_016813 [Halocaridina rubra]|uniref:C2H2-type domain-containing protein n=1 Tax=Halocaridina rubra TaxID=373956 RepID=A0AAN9ACE3_HALRR
MSEDGGTTTAMEEAMPIDGEKVKVMNGVKEDNKEVKLQNGDSEKVQLNGDIEMSEDHALTDEKMVTSDDHQTDKSELQNHEGNDDKESKDGNSEGEVNDSEKPKDEELKESKESEDSDTMNENDTKDEPMEVDGSSGANEVNESEEGEKVVENSDKKSDSQETDSEKKKESSDAEKSEETKDSEKSEETKDSEKSEKTEDSEKSEKTEDSEKSEEKEDSKKSEEKEEDSKKDEENKENATADKDVAKKDGGNKSGSVQPVVKGKKNRKEKSDEVQEVLPTRQLRVRRTPRKYTDDDDDIKIEKEVLKDDSDIEMIEESDPLALSDADVKKAQAKDKKEIKSKDSNVIIIDTSTLLKNQGNLAAAVAQSHSTSVNTGPTSHAVATASVATGTSTVSTNMSPSSSITSVSSVNIQTAIQAITGGVPAQGLQSAYITALQQVLLAQGGQVPMNSQHLAQLQQYYNSLGHLQDDAYVIEAPSFIVPYVMEGKPKEPIKAFLKRINKELEEYEKKEEEEKKKKEEEERKEKEEAEKKDSDNEKAAEDGDQKETELKEESEDSAEEKKEEEKNEECKKDENEEKSTEKDGGKEEKEKEENGVQEKDSQTQVDIDKEKDDSDIKVIGEKAADEDKENKEKKEADVVDLENEEKKEDLSFLGKWEPYYRSTLGKFILDLGLNQAQEFLQADLLRMQKKKLEKMKTTPSREGIINVKILEKQLEISRKKNSHLRVPLKTCKFCNFKTESDMVMDRHLESPHMVNYTYKCNFCEFETRGPQVILFHMEAEHNVRGRLERAPAFFQCSLCPYEDNNKSKMTRHSFSCSKKYKPEKNCELIDWEPPAKIPKIHRGRPNTLGKAFEPVKMPNLLPKGLTGFNLQSAVAANLLSSNSSALNAAGRGRGRPVGSYKTTGQIVSQGRGTGSVMYSPRGVTTTPGGNLVQQVGGNTQQFTLGNQMFHFCWLNGIRRERVFSLRDRDSNF